MTTVLLDADILCYRASSAVQKDIDWGDGLYTCHAYLSDAQETLYSMMESIEEKLKSYGYGLDKPLDYVFCFSGDNNFRKSINRTYKSNRSNTRKPTCYKALVDSVKESTKDTNRGSWKEEPNIECDDLIGIIGTSCDSIIVSNDKDFKTIPCNYLNFITGDLYNNKDQYNNAFNNIMYQTMVGDLTDGYKGAKGYGDKKAKSLISAHKDNPKELWDSVVKEAFKGNYDEAMLNYRMAHILWHDEYNFNNQEVIFKTPEELIETYINNK